MLFEDSTKRVLGVYIDYRKQIERKEGIKSDADLKTELQKYCDYCI